MWSDSNTLTDAPIAISGNDATFAGNVNLVDSTSLRLGNSNDFFITHNGSDTYLGNSTGILHIQQNLDDGAIKLQCDDGSGGTTSYLELQGHQTKTVAFKGILFKDSVKAEFGDSGDLDIVHTGTESKINNTLGDLKIQQEANDADIIFQCDDGSGGITEYFKLDGGNTQIKFSKNTNYIDGIQASFGNSGDLKISHSGTNSAIENEAGHFYIINDANDSDIVFQCDDGSGGIIEYFRVDGGTERIESSKSFRFADSARVQFGGSSDLQIYHDSTNSIIVNGTGDLVISQQTDDGDITFKCDNGSGGTTEYYRLDGSTAMNIFSKNVGVTGTVQATNGFTFATSPTSSPDFAIAVASNVMTIDDVSGGGKLILDVDNVGINTTSPTEALHVVGNVLANAFNTISDVRLKNDFKDFSGLDIIDNIKVYDFVWKNNKTRSYGVKAHELQEVLPHAVTGKKDDEKMQQVDYTKIVPILLKSIKELKQEIELLKSKL
jgi:hypothetical protein